MHFLDTNVVSDYFHRQTQIVERFNQAVRAGTLLAITVITRYEILMKGRYQAILAAENKERLQSALTLLQGDEILIDQFPTYSINDPAADHFERLRTAKGMRKIGRADFLIACITLAHGATLVTRNVKDFVKVPNLNIENWAK